MIPKDSSYMQSATRSSKICTATIQQRPQRLSRPKRMNEREENRDGDARKRQMRKKYWFDVMEGPHFPEKALKIYPRVDKSTHTRPCATTNSHA